MIKISLSIGSQIEIHTIKKVSLKGGTLIDGFPSGGLNVFHEFNSQRPRFGNGFTKFSSDIYGL